MTTEIARDLIAAGFFMMLVLHRIEAERFGTAEYDKPLAKRSAMISWAAWYAIGAAFLAAIFLVHPQPQAQLYLVVGHLFEALAYGLPLALLGAAAAAGYARFRYGYLRLPEPRAYPRAVVNSIATAVIDEAAFRGVALGALYSAGVLSGYAIAISAIAYVLATRLAAPDRRRFMLVPAFAYGFLGGWATLATGGLGAAIAFHAGTSFALFLCTGHSGQAAPTGREPEEIELARRPPDGWQIAPYPSAWGSAVARPRAGERGWPAVAAGVPTAPAPTGAAERVAAALGWLRVGVGRVVHRAEQTRGG